MTHAKHTPGPWYIRTNRHTSTDGRPWGWIDAAPPGGPQRDIPGVQVTWTRGESSEANARLIAAAPDLLRLLQEIVDSGLSMGRVKEARAAIDKATEVGMSEKQPEALKYADDLDSCSFGPNKIAALLRTQHADIERKDALLQQARLHVATSIAVNNNDSKAKNLYDAITKELQ